jgi:hypothetical protein
MHEEGAKAWLPPKVVAPLLKVTLPTCVLRRRRLSLHQHAPRSSPYDTGPSPTRHASWPRTEEAKPPRAERVTAQWLQALLHLHLNQRVKEWTAMQAACNCTIGAQPFDFDTSSMEAQAHTSCNRCAGYYVRKTAPPLAPVPRLLDCGTGAATRGDPAHGPAVPTEHIGHGSVSRRRMRDGRYGQKWAGSNGGGRRAEAAVKSSVGSRPLLGQRESPLPWREDDTPVFRSSNGSRNGCPANHSSRRIYSATGQATPLAGEASDASLRRNDRVKKGAPCSSISYPFPLPLSLSCYRDRERGYSKRDPSPRRKRAPSPPTDQRFEGWPLGRV